MKMPCIRALDMKYLCCLWLLFLTGCTTAGGSYKAPLPEDEDWYVGFFTPPYMEVWVERVDVEDAHGLYYRDVTGGTTATSSQEDPEGWPESMQVPMGAGRSITGAALPKRIFVRWQSLVEPQTYRITLDISESVREQMVKNMPYPKHPQDLAYQDILTIELAPGGWVKAWIKSTVSTPVEILCQKAEVEPKGPYGGLSGGKYRPLSERAAPYVETHPIISYDSWKCPEHGSASQ
ncbi:DUF2931 family protein [Dyella caseinilytica]|nr:DUF2931 family protein [Dyella caseinilytica]GGA08383.1 hypothetical protein GCM10011408_32200 [Dyella caseinilytica]